MSTARIAVLSARIAERDGKPGYRRNVAALKAELAKLTAIEAAKAANPAPDPKNLSGAPVA